MEREKQPTKRYGKSQSFDGTWDVMEIRPDGRMKTIGLMLRTELEADTMIERHRSAKSREQLSLF